MKKQKHPKLPFALILPLLLLGGPARGQQEESRNPFRKTPQEAPVDSGNAESFVTLVEQVLVPANLLQSWTDSHPAREDASDLRQAVGEWIHQGQATLDHLALSHAAATGPVVNETIVEQIYPTEYEPPKPGEWPLPTSFETRNIGYSATAAAQLSQGALALRAGISQVSMLQAPAYHALAERTRQPSDVFIPRFRSVTVSQHKVKPEPPQNHAEPADPFASGGSGFDPEPEKEGNTDVSFAPGRIHLASQTDVDESTAADRRVRLIFFRGVVREQQGKPESVALPENYQLSCRLYRVPQTLLAPWLESHDLLATPADLWSTVETWHQRGSATILANLGGTGRGGELNRIENTLEIVYPTEYEALPQIPAPDGKGTVQQFSAGTSFETRNIGVTAGVALSSDARGLLLKLDLDRCLLAGRSVHSRILNEGIWKEDITMPRFATNHWKGHLRVTRGQWQLFGIGGDLSEEKGIDSTHCVIAFVKVE